MFYGRAGKRPRSPILPRASIWRTAPCATIYPRLCKSWASAPVPKRPNTPGNRGVPLSFLSSCLGQIVIGFLGCWRLVEGAVTQHGIEGIEASSSQSNNGLFMGFLLGTFLVVVGARGGVVGLQ